MNQYKYCTHCGTQHQIDAGFCNRCGAQFQPPPSAPLPTVKNTRSGLLAALCIAAIIFFGLVNSARSRSSATRLEQTVAPLVSASPLPTPTGTPILTMSAGRRAAARSTKHSDAARLNTQVNELVPHSPDSSGKVSTATGYSSNSSRSGYITGPRGGCYYINSNGNKTYVDRSLCGTSYSFTSSSTRSRGGYITGPRGGCYYINGNGNKTYVDRSLCR